MAIFVARAEAQILTRLLPIRIVVRSLWESSFICIINLSTLDPSFERCMALIWLIEYSAVSEDEKKPDKKRQSRRIINSVVIKLKYLPFFYNWVNKMFETNDILKRMSNQNKIVLIN